MEIAARLMRGDQPHTRPYLAPVTSDIAAMNMAARTNAVTNAVNQINFRWRPPT